MSLQLANVLLPLLCLLCPCMGASRSSTSVLVVNQTPPYIHAVGGSEFTIRCALNINPPIAWFGAWNKTRNNASEQVSNGTNQIILADKEKMIFSLTVKKADVTDSGTYVCWVGTRKGLFPGSGTQVTIDEMTGLTVTQTPGSVYAVEGSELTMDCTFQIVTSLSTMYVRWYQAEGPQKELVNGSDVLTALRLESGLASLTLKNVKSSDTGRYVCEVGSTARNLSGTGAGTHVTIQTQPKAHMKCKKICTKFSKKIPQALLKSYMRTEPSCPKAAVIFVTQKSKEFCADPEESWVQEAIRRLDQTSAPQDPPPSSTVSSAAVPEDIGDLERLIGGTASVPRQAGVLTSPIPGAGTTVSQAVHGSGVRTEEPNTSTLTVQEAMRSSATPCSALNGTGPPSTIYTEPTANGSKGSMRSVDSANKSTDSAMSPATEVSATVPSRFIADPTTAVKLPESPTGPTYKSVSSSRN